MRSPAARPGLTVLLALMSVSACVSTGPTSVNNATGSSRIDVDSYVLLAELALEQQRGADAAGYYLEAAQVSNAPAYAERATRMAYRLSLNDIGHQAVARWRELVPGDERAEYFGGIFEFRSGRLDEAIAAFSNVLETLDESELASGIALILEALGSDIIPAVRKELDRRGAKAPIIDQRPTIGAAA